MSKLSSTLVALVLFATTLTVFPRAEASKRNVLATQVAALQERVQALTISVQRLISVQEKNAEAREAFYRQRPAFEKDLRASETELQVSLKQLDARMVVLEAWRWGLGGAFVLLCGVVGFFLRAYRAEIVKA